MLVCVYYFLISTVHVACVGFNDLLFIVTVSMTISEQWVFNHFMLAIFFFFVAFLCTSHTKQEIDIEVNQYSILFICPVCVCVSVFFYLFGSQFLLASFSPIHFNLYHCFPYNSVYSSDEIMAYKSESITELLGFTSHNTLYCFSLFERRDSLMNWILFGELHMLYFCFVRLGYRQNIYMQFISVEFVWNIIGQSIINVRADLL